MRVSLTSFIFIFLLFIKTNQNEEHDLLDLKNNNSTICDLKITTDNLVIFDKCVLSSEWKLSYEKTSSQNAIQVYEKMEIKRRIFNIEYIMDTHKNQKDIKFNNITIDVFDNNKYLDKINISNIFPLTLRKGDNFDVIVEYIDYNITYVDIEISIFIDSNINSQKFDLNFGYRKIVTDEFINKIDLSYLFLTIIFIIFVFLLR